MRLLLLQRFFLEAKMEAGGGDQQGGGKLMPEAK
jgi:hypothetical protein